MAESLESLTNFDQPSLRSFTHYHDICRFLEGEWSSIVANDLAQENSGHCNKSSNSWGQFELPLLEDSQSCSIALLYFIIAYFKRIIDLSFISFYASMFEHKKLSTFSSWPNGNTEAI